MLNISNKTIVYVICPAYNKTGGTELAHQLVYSINKNGICSKIAYYKNGDNPLEINPAFKKYVASFIKLDDIADVEDNIAVFPELNTRDLEKFNNIQKCIWWMSVDNYTKHHSIKSAYENYGLCATIKGILKGRLKLSKYPHFDKSVNHFYQSEYARDFLENSGITNVYRLSDYLNQEYLNVELDTERKDAVLYNPRKGFKFTKKLIEIAPELNWTALQNMSTEEVKNTLLHSKVYIDFGNHPGKDRFPREAAICGCCVITGKKGSARFFNDVPIDDEFKYDETKTSPKDIVAKIKQCLTEYEKQSIKYAGYRRFIKREYEIFENDVKQIFHVNKDV